VLGDDMEQVLIVVVVRLLIVDVPDIDPVAIAEHL
jgi:hypothetical protein